MVNFAINSQFGVWCHTTGIITDHCITVKFFVPTIAIVIVAISLAIVTLRIICRNAGTDLSQNFAEVMVVFYTQTIIKAMRLLCNTQEKMRSWLQVEVIFITLRIMRSAL